MPGKSARRSKPSAPPRPAAPVLPYQPPAPKRYRPSIGLIGCGGITQAHLTAYRAAGWRVVALCDLDESRARERQREFYPDAQVCTDHRAVLKRDDIDVVDIATHPPERAPLLRSALLAGKHVLSQKPFVTDIDYGKRLCDLADRQGVRLAVNQNGRWAPHVAWTRLAIARGLLGDVFAAHLGGHWDHNWVGQHAVFNRVHHIILYDYAIHWFDMLNCYLPERRPLRVHASTARAAGQKAAPPLLGQAMVEFDAAQASLVFDAATPFGSWEHGYVAGARGSIHYTGPSLQEQALTLTTARGAFSPALKGRWFPDGMAGTMGELLCAIEEKRQPSNSGRDNLRSLEMCFAALVAAETGKPQAIGQVRRAPRKTTTAT